MEYVKQAVLRLTHWQSGWAPSDGDRDVLVQYMERTAEVGRQTVLSDSMVRNLDLAGVVNVTSGASKGSVTARHQSLAARQLESWYVTGAVSSLQCPLREST